MFSNTTGGDRHRETQLQLQRKLHEREHVSRQKKKLQQMKEDNASKQRQERQTPLITSPTGPQVCIISPSIPNPTPQQRPKNTYPTGQQVSLLNPPPLPPPPPSTTSNLSRATYINTDFKVIQKNRDRTGKSHFNKSFTVEWENLKPLAPLIIFASPPSSQTHTQHQIRIN